MTHPDLLGQLSGLQTMMADLLTGVPTAAANARFHPRLASLGWYLGRAIYRELHWLREVLDGDGDLAGRVRHLFDVDEALAPVEQLPPPDHLLLAWFLLQERARDYEAMLWVLLARRWREASPPSLAPPAPRLEPRLPSADMVAITQGHYRVGSRGEPWAYDNELPPQAVELANFRIARRPVTNGEYLAFMKAGGYDRKEFWDTAGQAWLASDMARAPWHWRRDGQGGWHALGLNGPVPLVAEDPVAGLSHHEARAHAAWVASLGGALTGAVVQHEYQWEVAARGGHLEGTGRVWEWCANPFHPYPDFSPFPDPSVSAAAFGTDQGVLRGASLHTQRCLRRASFRHSAAPDDRFRISGLRLVFPPD